jgi:hypothetical protein
MPERRPLYYDSGNLREMTDDQIAQIKARMFWSYVSNPSVTLTVVNSGGNVGTLTDTRLQAGAASTSASGFPDEATTAEPTTVNVAIARIQQTIAADPNPATTPTQYPAYFTLAGDVRAMNLQDMYDTFAIDVFDGGWTAADGSTIYPSLINALIYKIHTTTSLTDYTAVPGPDGSTIVPVFTDTRADVAAYNAANIPEAEDQPIDTQNYYLFKKDVPALPALPAMVRVNTDGNVVAMTSVAIDTAIGAAIRYMVQSEVGYRIRYEYGTNGSGTAGFTVAGSAMTDSRLDGSGNYQTQQLGGDDYRAQEFPDGSPQNINVYTLQAYKQ